MKFPLLQAITTLVFLHPPLFAAELFPLEWVKKNLDLAQFFVYYGEPEERTRTLQEILEMGCKTGNLTYVIWAIQRQKETQLPFSDISHILEGIVLGGFDNILMNLDPFLNIGSLEDKKKERLIDLALEVGYPETVSTLQHLGLELSAKQQSALKQLTEALQRVIPICLPEPINSAHDISHGGNENRVIYLKEFRTSVAYALYFLENEECDFMQLISNLGHRRRHSAVLSRLENIEFYGTPTKQFMITYYDPCYVAYGEKIQEKYPLLPFLVSGQLNGKEIFLTQVNEDCWIHPYGDDREEILNYVCSLCHKMHRAIYPQDKSRELAYDLGKIIWWLSHAPPFLRGTPTIIAILMDAFCFLHNRPPLPKFPDLNCEALTYDNEEEFAQYMYNRQDLSWD